MGFELRDDQRRGGRSSSRFGFASDYTAFDAPWQKKNARLVYSTERVPSLPICQTVYALDYRVAELRVLHFRRIERTAMRVVSHYILFEPLLSAARYHLQATDPAMGVYQVFALQIPICLFLYRYMTWTKT